MFPHYRNKIILGNSQIYLIRENILGRKKLSTTRQTGFSKGKFFNQVHSQPLFGFIFHILRYNFSQLMMPSMLALRKFLGQKVWGLIDPNNKTTNWEKNRRLICSFTKQMGRVQLPASLHT